MRHSLIVVGKSALVDVQAEFFQLSLNHGRKGIFNAIVKNFRTRHDQADAKFFVRQNFHKRNIARNFLDALHFCLVDNQRDNAHSRNAFTCADWNMILDGGNANFLDSVNLIELVGVDVKHSVASRLEFDFAFLNVAGR